MKSKETPKVREEGTLVSILASVIKLYTVITVIIIGWLYFKEEATHRRSPLRQRLLSGLGFKRSELFDYLGSHPEFYPMPDTLPICNHTSLSPSSFLTDYVQPSIACYLPGYAKTWPAYELWKDS